MKPPVLLGVGAAIGLSLMLALVINLRSQTADGLSDFAAFYAGARSLATATSMTPSAFIRSSSNIPASIHRDMVTFVRRFTRY